MWKPGTKTVIKARDVKFFERIEDPVEFTSKKMFTVPDTIETANKERAKQQEDDIEDEDNSELLDERNYHNDEAEEDSSENLHDNGQEDNRPC